MKKVAIITITNSGLNFGNRLQNYALQEKIKERIACSDAQKILHERIKVETIYSANVLLNSLLLSKFRRFLKGIVKSSKRRQNFKAFNEQYIDGAKRIHYGKLNERAYDNDYIAFITGSDQVWNPNFHFNSSFEFLTFTSPEKRYAFSASFGVDLIPKRDQENYKKWLKEMNKLSVRENSGQGIIKALTGREACVHIDPSLLLTPKDYMKIEESPDNVLPKKYLLIYYLGIKTPAYKEFVAAIAKEKQLEVVEISEEKDTAFYHIGPQHVLYLFRQASYICTDSFHGTALSILFNRQFTVFFRQDKEVPMNDRIRTILRKMNLENRLFGQLTVKESVQQMNYKKINECLMEERKQAEDYIDEMIRCWV